MSADYAPASRTARAAARRRTGDGNGRNRIGFLLFLLALLLLLLWALAGALRGPVTTARGLHRGPEKEALAERAFLNAQLQLAGSDSINIILDARENRMWIVLKGVQLRECRLTSLKMDNSIRSLVASGNEAVWLDRPFTLLERRGNLPDPWTPVVEGKVDTLKGATAMKERPMEGSLAFDRGLVLHLDPPPTHADSLELQGWNGIQHRIERRAAEASAALNEITRGPASFDLYLQISREDAAAVLRALSVGGGMALRL